MTEAMDRRDFIAKGTRAGVGFGLLSKLPPLGGFIQERTGVVVGVMGVNSRGNELAKAFVRMGAEVRYICDVDSRAIENTVAQVSELQGSRPQGVTDFRRALDDPAVHGMVIAAPDHWHAPAALMALQAGKHVYLEKPCGHGPHGHQFYR